MPNPELENLLQALVDDVFRHVVVVARRWYPLEDLGALEVTLGLGTVLRYSGRAVRIRASTLRRRDSDDFSERLFDALWELVTGEMLAVDEVEAEEAEMYS